MNLYEILQNNYELDDTAGILYRLTKSGKVKLTPTGSSKQVVVSGNKYKLAELVYLIKDPTYEIGTKRILAVSYDFPTTDTVIAKEDLTIDNYKNYMFYDEKTNRFIHKYSWKGPKVAGSYVLEVLNNAGTPTVILDKDVEIQKATLVWHWYFGVHVYESTSRFVYIDSDSTNTSISNLILNTVGSCTTNYISPIRLRYLFNYTVDGVLTPNYPAKLFTTDGGYSVISLFNHTVGIHRILYALYNDEYLELRNPKYEIDHIDHNTQNNSKSNLRKVEAIANRRNKSLSTNNTSGYNGIKLFNGKYRVEIAKVYLGLYSTLEEALEKRDEFTLANGYHENHGKNI